MQLTNNTILITGGSEGIGLELARALASENTVIICGRTEHKLANAKAELPGVITMVCDVTDDGQRDVLVSEVLRLHPELNILVNNAGGRHRTDLIAGEAVETAMGLDLALNFIAPASLCTRFLDHLLKRPQAAIVNISTGLVYLPKAVQPFYCAAKAALHSYTQSLRWSLRNSSVGVHEVLMPLVDTNFHQGELPKTIRAMSAKDVVSESLRDIARNKEEIHIGKSSLARWMAFAAPRKGMAILNR